MLTREKAGTPLFNVIRWQYGAVEYTFAHEIGHNLGCAHDRLDIDVPGIDSWARGYRFRGNDGVEYRTVMAYAPGTRIPYLSNPNIRFKGVPTGLPAGSGFEADNASTIAATAPMVGAEIENHPGSEPPRLTMRKDGTKVRLTIQGSPGIDVLIETSTDLVNWLPLTNLELNSSDLILLRVQGLDSPNQYFGCRTL